MKEFWKSFGKTFFDFLKGVAVLLFVLILVVFLLKLILAPSKSIVGNPVSISETTNNEVWQGVIAGDIRVNGNFALARVVIPEDGVSISNILVIYAGNIVPVKEVCSRWKVGEKIIFRRETVSSYNYISSIGGDSVAEIGLFVAFGDWREVSKKHIFSEDYILANPPKK